MTHRITDYASIVAVAVSAETPKGLAPHVFYPFLKKVLGDWATTSHEWDMPYYRAVRFAPFIVVSEDMLWQWALHIADNVKSPKQRVALFKRSVWAVMYAYDKMPFNSAEVLYYLQQAFGFNDRDAEFAQVQFPFMN